MPGAEDTRTNAEIVYESQRGPGWSDRSYEEDAEMAVAALAAAGRLVTPDHIVIPRPRVAHGPAGIPAHVSDADYLREAARHVRGGFPVGGSNLSASVAKLLDDAAEAIVKGAAS